MIMTTLGRGGVCAAGVVTASATSAQQLKQSVCNDALFTTRPVRLPQAPGVLRHHQGRQFLREPQDCRVACVG